jgi:hypothetical protein
MEMDGLRGAAAIHPCRMSATTNNHHLDVLIAHPDVIIAIMALDLKSRLLLVPLQG